MKKNKNSTIRIIFLILLKIVFNNKYRYNLESFRINNNMIDDNYNEIKEWLESNGDQTYIFDHDLNTDSIVMDLGAFKGLWAEQLNNRIKCNIYLLEPVKQFYLELENKFSMFDNIKYRQVGVSTSNISLNLPITVGDSTQIRENDSDEGELIHLVTLEDIMKFWNITHIDLLQINIEGAEYEVLENWLESETINKIKILQIQFHNFGDIDNHVSRRKNIQKKLQERGYKLKYNFQWVWECWQK